jgi:hypothetical protein|tara:strand:+ start:7264 stop:7593 length:330 start_codon:yes stop_codon:yes gene_type:complete
MLILTSGEAIGYALTAYPHMPRSMLMRYAAMIATEPIAWIFLVQPGDTEALLHQLRGRPFADWEFIELSDGWFEAVFIHSDWGFGHAVLLSDQPTTDSALLTICRANQA